MKTDFQLVKPEEIEKQSFAIITRELGQRRLDPENEAVIKRAIHTTADFDYADNLCFSPGAVKKAAATLRGGAHILTDTQMALSGINKSLLQSFGGRVHCFMAEKSVAQEAKRRGITRAMVSMERGAGLNIPLLIAIGNAPTALIRLYQLIEGGKIRPELVIGVPVGFVNVVEAKELIMTAGVPYIVARGRKGGSNVAAAICNALLLTAEKDEKKGDTDER